MKIILSGKIKGIVTGTDLFYGGSITIGEDLLKSTSIVPAEQVHVLNVNNGERFITYVMVGGGKEICLNGAAARLGQVGDELIILSYEIRDG